MGVLGVLVGASVAVGQLVQVWDKIERYPGDIPNVLDEPADMAAWFDLDAMPARTWVYVTGTMTNAVGGTVIATYRYDADTGAVELPMAFYPTDWASTTLHHKAAALAIDPKGDGSGFATVYVVGEVQNASGSKDYAVLKYRKTLQPHDSWPNLLPQNWGVGARRYNRGGSINDVGVDVVYAQSDETRYVIALGTTRYQTGNDDITTVWYDDATGAELHADHYDGPGQGGADTASEMAVFAPSGLVGPAHVIVAGTSWGGATRDDLVAIRYDNTARSTEWADAGMPPGQPGWGEGVRRYNGPDNGDEFCTGISHDPQSLETLLPVLIGRTPASPAYPADTEYVLWAIIPSGIGAGNSLWNADPVYGGVRVIPNGYGDVGTMDTAMDAVNFGTNEVRVTGEMGFGTDFFSVGTFSVSLDPAGTVSGGVFASSLISDDHGLRITTDASGRTYVAGWSSDPSTDPPTRMLTLRFPSGDLTAPDATARYYPEFGADARAQAIWWQDGARLFVTGKSIANQTYLYDWGTIRYLP